MKVLFTALVAASTMCGVAMAQDKSKEVVGSAAKVVLKTTKTMVDKPLKHHQGKWNRGASETGMICDSWVFG